MGLLDDAIREHLELKRRRGADPAEIERAERDALGPVRRQPEEPDDLSLAHEPLEEEPAYAEEQWAAPFEDEPEMIPQQGEARAVEHDAEADHAEHEAVPQDDEYLTEPAMPETPRPHPASAPAPADLPHHLSAETEEYEVELEHQNEKEGEDMLEETPEFLQDTPDHDRLWFEQRPPRDFDFDG